MSEEKVLSSKQLAVIDDLFECEKEREILKKHRLSRKLYDRWLADKAFARRLDECLVRENRRFEFNLARSACRAMSSLVKMAESKQGETSRKACLDIIEISANRSAAGPASQADNPSGGHESAPLPPETAAKLLAALAKEKNAS